MIVATQTKTLALSPDDLEVFIGTARVSSTSVASGDTPQFDIGGNLTGRIVCVSGLWRWY